MNTFYACAVAYYIFLLILTLSVVLQKGSTNRTQFDFKIPIFNSSPIDIKNVSIDVIQDSIDPDDGREFEWQIEYFSAA